MANQQEPGDRSSEQLLREEVEHLRARLGEMEQKRQEELAAETRRKDEFLGMLAHELRSPLAPIRNAVQILRVKAPIDPELRWARDVIDRQILRLTRLLDDLLDVSRIARGKIKLQLETIDLGMVAARTLETVRPIMDAQRHEWTVQLPPGRLRLSGDAARLAQVLGNLLTNAAKFTPEGGRIGLTVEQQAGEAVIRVSDTGAGIAAELLPRIFDLFTQPDPTMRPSQGGLGLGLTLVKNLVEMHGGSVAVRSDGPGKGCEFTVRLPLLAESAGPPGRSRRLLVVDDNPDAAESLAMLLQQLGHEAQVVLDGAKVLQAAAAFGPEVVFLDIGLPGMSGHEVGRRLRQIPGLERVRLVALTGYGQEEDRRRSMESGFDEHWVKPVDLDALRAFLAALP